MGLPMFTKRNNYAFTLTSGASLTAPFLRYNRVFIYFQGSSEKLAKDLDFKKVASGPNISILQPYYEGVFYDIQKIEGKKVVLKEKKETIQKTTSDEKKPEKEVKQKVYAAGKVIETDFDSLYNLVLEKNKVKISEVAKMFKIDKKKAEEWVQILDEHGLVQIHYPPMGEPEIRKLVQNEKVEE